MVVAHLDEHMYTMCPEPTTPEFKLCSDKTL